MHTPQTEIKRIDEMSDANDTRNQFLKNTPIYDYSFQKQNGLFNINGQRVTGDFHIKPELLTMAHLQPTLEPNSASQTPQHATRGQPTPPRKLPGLSQRYRKSLPPVPYAGDAMSGLQLDNLLGKVGMDNTFLSIAGSDNATIKHLKDTIQHMQGVMQKREKLVFAITNNVQYLSALHKTNTVELKRIRDTLRVTLVENEDLKAKNRELDQENADLRQFKDDLLGAQKQINDMLIASQANAEEIFALNEAAEVKEEEVTKLKIEV